MKGMVWQIAYASCGVRSLNFVRDDMFAVGMVFWLVFGVELCLIHDYAP